MSYNFSVFYIIDAAFKTVWKKDNNTVCYINIPLHRTARDNGIILPQPVVRDARVIL